MCNFKNIYLLFSTYHIRTKRTTLVYEYSYVIFYICNYTLPIQLLETQTIPLRVYLVLLNASCVDLLDWRNLASSPVTQYFSLLRVCKRYSFSSWVICGWFGMQN